MVKSQFLEWVFGVRTIVPIVNISTKYRGVILYAASNVGVLYNYESDTMKMLKGHVRFDCTAYICNYYKLLLLFRKTALSHCRWKALERL